jgi:plastocyanin domain-containing protein
MTSEEARAVLDTMGPAVNRQVYTSLKQVPVSFSVSPAVEIPLNADGVQEVTLVVTPNGYNPEHFSVRKGILVRLTFRQLREVGCGAELIIQWGEGKNALLTLASAGDSQTIEFTPGETGDFRFNCAHLYYRGIMTVLD